MVVAETGSTITGSIAGGINYIFEYLKYNSTNKPLRSELWSYI